MKAAGRFLLFVVGAVVLHLLAAVLMRGMYWASTRATPWFVSGSEITFAIDLLILLPMCIFRITRGWGAMGLYFSSFVFGLSLWAFSCFVCVTLWGYGALFEG